MSGRLGFILFSCLALGIARPAAAWSTTASSSGLAARSVEGEIAILADDGTMIANRVFVLDRLMPALFTVLPDTFDLVNVFGSSAFSDSMFPSASECLVRNHVAGLGMSADLNRNAVIGIRTKNLGR